MKSPTLQNAKDNRFLLIQEKIKELKSSGSSYSGKKNRFAVIVLGMHRSGTSALTRTLSMLGCDLPKVVLPANQHNQSGYWESEAIVALNNDILDSAGSSWCDLQTIDPKWYLSPKANELRDRAIKVLEQEFCESHLFVLKDPRICRLVPFWLDALESFGVSPRIILPIRHPLEVALSSSEMKGLEPTYVKLLWLAHVLESERFSRGHLRCFTSYDHLLLNWKKVAVDAEKKFGFSWPRLSAQSTKISEFLSQSSRHQREEKEAFLEDSSVSVWLREVYQILDRWSEVGENAKDYAVLDRVHAELNAATPFFVELYGATESYRKRASKLKSQLSDVTDDLETKKDELRDREHHILQAESKVEEYETALKGGEKDLSDARKRLLYQEELLSQQASELSRCRNQEERAQRAIDELQHNLLDQEQKVFQKECELGELRENTTQLQRKVEELLSRLAVSEDQLLRKDEQQDHWRKREGCSQKTIENLRANLIDSEEQLNRKNEELESWLERQKQAQREIEDLTGRLAASEKILSNKDKELKTWRERSGGSHDMIQELRSSLLDLERELSAEKDKLSHSQRREADLQRSVDGLRSRLEVLEMADDELSRPVAQVPVVSSRDEKALRVPKSGEPFSFPVPTIRNLPWVRQVDLIRREDDTALLLSGLVLGLFAQKVEEGDVRGLYENSHIAVKYFCLMLKQDPVTEMQLHSKEGVVSCFSNPLDSCPMLDPGANVSVRDLWLSGTNDLRMRCEALTPVVLRCYQHDLDSCGAPVLVSEAMLPGIGISLVDARLRNPFLPLLLTSSTPDGHMLASALLPFPSLVRGGLHAGEVCAAANGERHADVLRRVSEKMLSNMLSTETPWVERLLLDVSHATGSEPSFSTPYKQWLMSVMGVVAEPVPESLPSHPGQRTFLKEALVAPSIAVKFMVGNQADRRLGAATLTLPNDAVPTLQALTARATRERDERAFGHCRLGSFIACDRTTGAPRQMIVVPDSSADLTGFHPKAQPVWPMLGNVSTFADGAPPVALRFCGAPSPDDPRMLLPMGAKALEPLLQQAREVQGRIAVLLIGQDGLELRSSISRQTVASEVEVLSFPDGAASIDPAALVDFRFLLIASGGVTLYDIHALEVLRLLASIENIASAGCTLTGETIIKKKPVLTFKEGGLQAVQPSHAPGELTLSRGDVRAALPFATVPSAGNSEKLFMVTREIFQRLGGVGVDGVEGYAMRALNEGFHHLATDAVRASINKNLQVAASSNLPSHLAKTQEVIRNNACVFEELAP